MSVAPKSLSYYIHIPFCVARCAYCDFASWAGQEDYFENYIQCLMAEMDLWAKGGWLQGFQGHSIFIGGGTPSVLPGRMIEKILDRLSGLTPMAKKCEITLEANPGTLTGEKLAAWQRSGINRLSFGAQSFDDGLLKTLGRIHRAADIDRAVESARDAGFENINLDLMYALPGQTMAIWESTLDQAIGLQIPHISAYSLIVEPGTPMAAWVDGGKVHLPDEDTVNAMQRRAIEKLEDAGLGRYEISNFARSGHESRHNITYWRRGDYLGLGCAAHSMMMGWRFENVGDLKAYLSVERQPGAEAFSDFLEKSGYRQLEAIDRSGAMEETLMLSTRMCQGLDLEKWALEFGEDFLKPRKFIVENLCREGILKLDRGHLMLTRRGMEVQNAVVLALLDGI